LDRELEATLREQQNTCGVALMFCSQRRVERRRGPDAAILDSDKMLAEHVRLEESNLNVQVQREGGHMIGSPRHFGSQCRDARHSSSL
jgi:hypothetical protein